MKNEIIRFRLVATGRKATFEEIENAILRKANRMYIVKIMIEYIGSCGTSDCLDFGTDITLYISKK